MTRTRPFDLVIFDFDGTLANSGPWFADVFNGVARRYRFKEADEADFKRLRGEDPREALRRFGVASWKLPFIARHMRGLMARDIARIRLFPGAARLLVDFHMGGVRLAIASSNARANIEAVLGPRTAALIDDYACGASLLGKATKLKAILKRSRIPASRVIAIGDEIRDIEAAEAAGIVAGLVAWGYGSPDALRGRHPAFVFETLEAIRSELLGSAELP